MCERERERERLFLSLASNLRLAGSSVYASDDGLVCKGWSVGRKGVCVGCVCVRRGLGLCVHMYMHEREKRRLNMYAGERKAALSSREKSHRAESADVGAGGLRRQTLEEREERGSLSI